MRRITLLLLVTMMARAEVRRALIVGIDEYMDPGQTRGYRISELTRNRLKAIHGSGTRSKIEPLEGAANDARAMKEMLIAKFGFDEANIILLPNSRQAATADNILGLLQSFLIDAAKPGDVSLFYYAGHGSRIRNTAARNNNPGGLDSTIIPADAAMGVPDIRGKELARIYAQAAPRHVALTVILDSCFSGAASRGAMARNRTRDQRVMPDVSVEETLDVPLPEDSGVLILSASQDYEPAAELPSTDLDGPHGAFTWALLHVLGASPADERVDHIFQRVRAMMQSQVAGQEPVLLAKHGLNAGGLFGQAAGAEGHVTIAAGRVNEKHVKLNGGLAMGLEPGCELKRAHPLTPAARLRVTRVNGLSSSDAEIIEGNVTAGDLFEIEKWVAPDRAALQVFTGPAAPSEEVKRGAAVASELRRIAPGVLVDDPTEHAPAYLIVWDGVRWVLKENAAGAKNVAMSAMTARAVVNAVAKNARVEILIPPTEELRKPPTGGSVSMTDSVDRADYVLVGRACTTGAAVCVEYAWALPDLTAEDLHGRHTDRPLRSDWFVLNAETSGHLNDAALTLARVTGWLRLSESAAGSPWAYRLALERAGTSELLDSGEVHGDERYQLVLRGDPDLLKRTAFIAPRWVYVFAVDSWGHAALLAGDNLRNQFPRVEGGSTPPETIALHVEVVITPPFGVDHYYLLTSANPIDSPQTVLNFDGVRTRGGETPLARLLRNTATATRGEPAKVPVNWSIEQVTIVSRPAEGK